MRRSFRIFLCIGASGGASLVSAAAHADFVPGDLLVTMELSVVAGEGRIYRVNDGGDFSEATPDFAMPAGPDDGSPAHIIDICSTDDGRVLVATSVTQTVYDVTSGVREVFATIPDDASGLYCGHGKVYVTSFLVEPKMFDITAGGEVTEPFAVGVNRSPVIDRGGRIWASRFDLEGGQDRGVFRDIHPGDDLSHATSWFQGFDVFSAVLADDRVMAVFSANDAIADVTDGGMPMFAHAIVPGVRGVTSSNGSLWASTIEGKVYDVTGSADYTNLTPFAQIPGPSLSLAVVQRCGDGRIDGREECDGEPSCKSDCTLPHCGDGIVDGGEECDDANTDDDDGCSADCETEAQPTGPATSSHASSAQSQTSSGAGGKDSGEGGAGGSASSEGGSGCAVGGAELDSSSLSSTLMVGLALAARRRKNGPAK